MAKRNDGLMGVTAAAKVLGVSERQVRNLIESGVLPAEKVGRTWVVKGAELAKVPKDRKRGPKPRED